MQICFRAIEWDNLLKNRCDKLLMGTSIVNGFKNKNTK